MHAPSRRTMLGAGLAGLGASALTGLNGLAGPTAADAAPASSGCPMSGGGGTGVSTTFGRLFPTAPAFADNTPELRDALLAVGAPGGPLDADDDLFGPNGGPVNLITDPNLSVVNKNNPRDTAGMTFVGQFLDHDITFEVSSRLGQASDPTRSVNLRTARLDLDSVYGLGPIGQAELYDPAHPIKFLVESGGRFEDVPRRADNTAIIGDPRNDTNMMVSGLHAAFLKFHNNAVDALAQPGDDVLDTFDRARQATTAHWQWLVVNRVLPIFVGQDMVDDVLHLGAKWYKPGPHAFIPVEFSGAAYRMGHSMVRPSYRANLAGDNGNPFFGLVFDSRIDVPDGQNPATEPDDLRGGFRAARRFIGWQTFFDFGGAYTAAVRPNKIIDTKLSTPLFTLPTSAIAHVPGSPGPIALPQRTLLRHLTWSLPSGQAIAKKMRVAPLQRADLADFAAYGQNLDRSTPLWLYVLREAEVVHGGQYLGPVGGRIVAETILGLLQADPDSYLNQDPGWTPTLYGNGGADYGIADFLRFAGVDPATRGE